MNEEEEARMVNSWNKRVPLHVMSSIMKVSLGTSCTVKMAILFSMEFSQTIFEIAWFTVTLI